MCKLMSQVQVGEMKLALLTWLPSHPHEGHGSLACCSPWGCKESNTTQRLNSDEAYGVLLLQPKQPAPGDVGPWALPQPSHRTSGLRPHPLVALPSSGKACFLPSLHPPLPPTGHLQMNRMLENILDTEETAGFQVAPTLIGCETTV